MRTEVNLADLKAGDEVPADAIVRDVYLPVFGDSGVEWIHLTNVPVAAFA